MSEPHPKNVQAVIAWVKKNRPNDVGMFEKLFSLNRPHTSTEGVVAAILIGFEAGRLFEKENPSVVSGSGYAP
jgi:hypothetical protein